MRPLVVEPVVPARAAYSHSASLGTPFRGPAGGPFDEVWGRPRGIARSGCSAARRAAGSIDRALMWLVDGTSPYPYLVRVGGCASPSRPSRTTSCTSGHKRAVATRHSRMTMRYFSSTCPRMRSAVSPDARRRSISKTNVLWQLVTRNAAGRHLSPTDIAHPSGVLGLSPARGHSHEGYGNHEPADSALLHVPDLLLPSRAAERQRPPLLGRWVWPNSLSGSTTALVPWMMLGPDAAGVPA